MQFILGDDTANQPTPQTYSSQVPANVRRLAVDDITAAILKSNRQLADKMHYSMSLFKPESQIRTIAKNTEQSLYTMLGDNFEQYVSNLLAILVFISDKSIMQYSYIFRLMINTEFNDLISDIQESNLYFPEAFYSTLSKAKQNKITASILDYIDRYVCMIMNDYRNGRRFIQSNSTNLVIDSNSRNAMAKYRDKFISQILPNHELDKDLESESSDIYQSSISDIIDGDNQIDDDGNVVVPTDLFKMKPVYNPKAENDGSAQLFENVDAQSESGHSTESSLFTINSESSSNTPSIFSNDVEDKKTKRPVVVDQDIESEVESENTDSLENTLENTDSESSELSTESEELDDEDSDYSIDTIASDRVKANSCIMCPSKSNSNYKSIYFSKKQTPRPVEFCGPECMEKWKF